jgi:hypothetical protein
MLTRWRLAAVLALLFAGVAAFLVITRNVGLPLPPLPPVPPGAMNLLVQSDTSARGWPDITQGRPEGADTGWISITSFRHEDVPERVRDFYDAKLAEQGWEPDRSFSLEVWEKAPAESFGGPSACLDQTYLRSYSYQPNRSAKLKIFIKKEYYTHVRIDVYTGEYFITIDASHTPPVCWYNYP